MLNTKFQPQGWYNFGSFMRVSTVYLLFMYFLHISLGYFEKVSVTVKSDTSITTIIRATTYNR